MSSEVILFMKWLIYREITKINETFSLLNKITGNLKCYTDTQVFHNFWFGIVALGCNGLTFSKIPFCFITCKHEIVPG